MASYTRNDRPLNNAQAGITQKRMVAELGGTPGDYIFEYGGENPGLVRVSTALDVQDRLNSFMQLLMILPLQVDLPEANTGQTVTFTCVDNKLLGDAAVDYVVYLGERQVAAGTKTVTGNAMDALSLETDTAGTYIVEIRRQARPDGFDPETGVIDNAAVHLTSGMVIVEVTDA